MERESLTTVAYARIEVSSTMRLWHLLGLLTALASSSIAASPVQSSALVAFSYSGQEHKRTFLSKNRVFEFPKLKRRRVKIEQEYKKDGAGLGSAVWDGAFVLSDYLQGAEALQGKCVVEIGCGLGLVSIVAANSGAKRVIATDGDTKLFTMLKRNIINNTDAEIINSEPPVGNGKDHAMTEVFVQPLRWGNTTQINQVKRLCPDGAVDIVFAADVVFEHDPMKQTNDDLHQANTAFQELVDTFFLLAHRNTVVWLAYKHRYKRENSFFSKVKEHFSLETIPRSKIHRDFIKAKIKIYKLALKADSLPTLKKVGDEL